MILKIPLWSNCWPILLIILSLASVMDKFTLALNLTQETGFWESTTSQSISPKMPTTPPMGTKEVVTLSESSRLIRLEREFSLLKNKFSWQESKNEEYDKVLDFMKEFRIKQTESESNQKLEIETLKGIVSKMQSKEETRDDEMKQLKERLNQIATIMSEDHYQHQIVKRQNPISKKPSITTRLPACIPKNACAFDFKSNSGDKMATSNSISKSFKLPSSCKDLSTNGHTLNGIYLLYDSNVKKVSTAFCDFNNNKSAQLFLGFMNVKSLPEGVHFYAQRTQTFKKKNAVIPFDRVLMNEGGGLNGSTGIFRAPKPGIYRFLFHGSKEENQAAELNIHLRVNAVTVGNAFAINSKFFSLPVGVHLVVKLRTGDEVVLFKVGNGWLSDDDTPDTHFSGWLVEENLLVI